MLSRLFIAALWSPEKRAGLLALVCDVYCDFIIFPFGTLGQVWWLIVSIPDPCCFLIFKRILLVPTLRPSLLLLKHKIVK